MLLHEQFSQDEMETLKTRAERVATSLQHDDSTGCVKVLLTILGHERYAVPISAIKAVYQNVPIVHVPCAPDFIAGIANLRGHLISVLDLAVILGLESSRLSESDLIVAELDDSMIGFHVESIGEVVELSMSQITSISANMDLIHPTYLRGISSEGTILLNMDAILNDPSLIVDESPD